ncbi:MAG: hypothetical protein HY913_04615 [Desulfomonile tiedjei]|nr:hypothetical protein [Desulfomonile tiedjei]
MCYLDMNILDVNLASEQLSGSSKQEALEEDSGGGRLKSVMCLYQAGSTTTVLGRDWVVLKIMRGHIK